MHARRTLLLTGLFIAMFFISLDQTVVGTAMPRIIGDLNGLAVFAWVTITYLLTFTVTGPVAGKLADLFGRRGVFTAGLATFIVGSALCGTSATITQLILWRALQGLGAGMMLPMIVTILGDIFPPEKLGKWQGVFMSVNALSSIVGPTVGGWLVDQATWRWVFYVNLPFGLLALAIVFLGLGRSTLGKRDVKIDIPGALTFVVGVTALLLGLNLGGHLLAWSSWQIVGLFAVALVSLVGFVLIERKAKEPLISLDLFRTGLFTRTNLLGLLAGFSMFGAVAFLPLFLQGALGMSATRSGNIMIPLMAALIVGGITGGQLVSRLRYRTLFVAGFLLMSAAFFLLATIPVTVPHALAIAYLVIMGLGLGLVLPTLNLVVQNTFPAERRGVATSATLFFRAIGSTLGLAVLSVVFNAYSSGQLERELVPRLAAFADAGAGAAVAPLVEMATKDPQALFSRLLSPEAAAALPVAVSDAILPTLRDVLTRSVHVVFITAGSVALAGLLLSFLLGNARVPKRQVEGEPVPATA